MSTIIKAPSVSALEAALQSETRRLRLKQERERERRANLLRQEAATTAHAARHPAPIHLDDMPVVPSRPLPRWQRVANRLLRTIDTVLGYKLK